MLQKLHLSGSKQIAYKKRWTNQSLQPRGTPKKKYILPERRQRIIDEIW